MTRAAASTAPEGGAGAGPRDDVSVLVIDDDLDTRMVLEEVLRSEGYTVLTAPNGAEALELLRARAPRLILLDLTMPVMGGAEFRRVQVEDLELAAIPTLVMTARSDPKTQIDGLSVRGYLSKPLALDELLRVVALYCPADCAGRPPEATPVLPKGGRPR